MYPANDFKKKKEFENTYMYKPSFGTIPKTYGTFHICQNLFIRAEEIQMSLAEFTWSTYGSVSTLRKTHP